MGKTRSVREKATLPSLWREVTSPKSKGIASGLRIPRSPSRRFHAQGSPSSWFRPKRSQMGLVTGMGPAALGVSRPVSTLVRRRSAFAFVSGPPRVVGSFGGWVHIPNHGAKSWPRQTFVPGRSGTPRRRLECQGCAVSPAPEVPGKSACKRDPLLRQRIRGHPNANRP